MVNNEEVVSYSPEEKAIIRAMARAERERREALEKSRPEDSHGYTEEEKETIRSMARAERERREGLSGEEEMGIGSRIGQVGRGALKTYGGLADIANMVPGYPTMMGNLSSNYEPVENIQGNPLAEELPKAVDALYGRDLTPTDKMGKFSEGIGEFMAPLPIPGGSGYVGAAKAGLSALGKHFGKEAAIAGGASAATNLTPRFSEEGTWGGGLEDIAKAAVGAKTGQVASGLRPGKILAKGASSLIEPNEEILRKAQKHNVELPFNVGANSKTANFIANNTMKSVYASKQYKEALKKSDASMIDSVKRSIDTLGDSNLKPHEASAGYREHLKEQEKVFKKQADELYTKARESLGKNDKIVPKKTIKALNSEPIEELLNNLSPSSSEKSVISRINEIKGKLSGESKVSKAELKRYKDNPKYLALLKGSNPKETSVKDLISLRSSLMKTLDYEPEVRGSSAFLSRLVKTLDEDIKNIPNKEFLGKYETANQFFKQEIGQRFRKSIAQSIMRNEAPRDAFELLNSVDNIKILEKIVGQESKGKEIFDSLKKAKVRDIIGNSIQGDLQDGALRTGAFSKLFQKGEKRQEVLETLLGKKEYHNLSEIADIAEEFSKSGRELLNTSGTAHVLSDINATKSVASEAYKYLSFLTGAGGHYAYGVPGAVVGAAVPLGATYVVSRLVANPKFVSQMRAYALARKQGSDKYANTIMKKIAPIVVKEINNQNSSQQEGMNHD